MYTRARACACVHACALAGMRAPACALPPHHPHHPHQRFEFAYIFLLRVLRVMRVMRGESMLETPWTAPEQSATGAGTRRWFKTL